MPGPTDQGKNWNDAGTATPDQSVFAYNAPGDGLYYFNLVIVDRQNHRDPPDVRTIPPAMRVLIDTSKPIIRINGADRVADDVQVSWDITEDNLELATMKLEYRTPENPNWTPVTINQASSGLARFRVAGASPVTVRMQVMDRQNLQLNGSAAPRAPRSIARQARTNAGRSRSRPPRVRPRIAIRTAGRRARAGAVPPPASPARASVQPYDPGRLVALRKQSSRAGVYTGRAAAAASAAHRQQSADHARLRSGCRPVGRGTWNWMTQDDGRTCRGAEDTDAKPPMTVDLPGEGVRLLSWCRARPARAGAARRRRAGDASRWTRPRRPPGHAPEPDPKGPTRCRSVDRQRPQPGRQRHHAAMGREGQWHLGDNGPTCRTRATTPGSCRRTCLTAHLRSPATRPVTSHAETPEPVPVDLNEPEALDRIGWLTRRQ